MWEGDVGEIGHMRGKCGRNGSYEREMWEK